VKNDEKAQLSIETLILIGGAIIVATAIGLYLKAIAGSLLGRVGQETGQIGG